MKYFLYLIFIVVMLGLSAGVAFAFSIKMLVPSIILVTILVFALDRNSQDFFFVAVSSGLLLDLYSGSLVGSFTVPFLIGALILNLLIRNVILIEINGIFIIIAGSAFLVFVYIGSWLYSLFFSRLFLGSSQLALQPTWKYFLPDLIINLILFLPLFFLIEWLRAKQKKLFDKKSAIL